MNKKEIILKLKEKKNGLERIIRKYEREDYENNRDFRLDLSELIDSIHYIADNYL